jgi:hypothetical protein
VVALPLLFFCIFCPSLLHRHTHPATKFSNQWEKSYETETEWETREERREMMCSHTEREREKSCAQDARGRHAARLADAPPYCHRPRTGTRILWRAIPAVPLTYCHWHVGPMLSRPHLSASQCQSWARQRIPVPRTDASGRRATSQIFSFLGENHNFSWKTERYEPTIWSAGENDGKSYPLIPFHLVLPLLDIYRTTCASQLNCSRSSVKLDR